jgi:hypothetical protein
VGEAISAPARGMNHIYIGVNCKKCRKPIATEKITPEQRDAQQGRVFKERDLTCLIGHRRDACGTLRAARNSSDVAFLDLR